MKTLTIAAIVCNLFMPAHAQNNVGIGTSIPTANLHIQNPLKAVVKISSTNYNDSSHLIFSNRTGASGTDMILAFNRERGLGFSSQSDLPEQTINNIMFLSSTGNVGIRNNTPQFPLDISGTLNLGGNLRISGTTGNPGDIISIKPNGAMFWTPGSETITDTLTIQPYTISENPSFPFFTSETLFYGYGPNTGGTVVFYYAPIQLPVSNAAIKEIRAYLYDADASSQILVNVYETPLTSTTFAQRNSIAQLFSSGSSTAMQENSWTPATSYPIQNGTNSYFLRLRTLSGTWPGGTNLGFRALRIIYTYTR